MDGRTFFWPDLELAEGPELLWSFLRAVLRPANIHSPRIVVPWLPKTGSAWNVRRAGRSGLRLSGKKITLQHSKAKRNGLTPPERDSNGHAPDEVESLEALEAALADARGGIVRIAKPRNAAEARLVDMAVSNAREAAVTKSEVPMSDRLAAAFALDKVQSALPGPSDGIPPHPAHRMCGRFPHGRHVHPRGHGRLRGRAAPEIRITAPMPLKAKRPATATTTPPAEWMRRRLESGPPWADLVLIDGGRGQVSAVQRIVRESNAEGLFLLAGIAKARDDMGRADRRAGNVGDRIFLPGRSNPLPLRDGSAELLFLQHIRDTAHHFVIGRHRRARAGAALSAELLPHPRRRQGHGPAALGSFQGP